MTSTNDIRNFKVLPGKNAWEDAILLQMGSRTENMRQKSLLLNAGIQNTPSSKHNFAGKHHNNEEVILVFVVFAAAEVACF